VVIERLQAPLLGPALFVASISAVPTAIGVVVLRAGLYEIDRLLNRTLVYGALRHEAWRATSQPCGPVSLPPDAAMQ
jgi:hypothetical protein